MRACKTSGMMEAIQEYDRLAESLFNLRGLGKIESVTQLLILHQNF